MRYYIYLIKVGSAKYVGSTNNYQRRMAKHKKDLKDGTHVNDKLLKEFKKGKPFFSKKLATFNTLFRYQVLTKEQRYINRYSNSNEGVASKTVKYSGKEFCFDMIDFIVNHWKLVSILIFISLIFGFGMSTEQANQIIETIVKLYQGG